MAFAFLDKNRTVVGPGFNRWLIPPAALAIHLCIGQAYAFSVFNLPLTKLIGITASAPGDWKLTDVIWIFTIGIVFLGLSAALFGRWVEEGGPRRAMFTAALCFGLGFIVSSFGASVHQLWIIYLGYGVLGGCGLGIGYISPVSTLIKWFPDRPGMATGLAIMGFGGGAFIGAPLSVLLMKHFASSTDVGLTQTFLVMGIIYGCVMMVGAAMVRIPAHGWMPAGYTAAAAPQKLVTTQNVHVDEALKTPQFWLLWLVLCMNVSAGIGILSQASPMIQDIFSGRITPIAAAGFVGVLSLCNMLGRIIWASSSDYMGRRTTYMVFFILGIVLYCLIPTFGNIGSVGLFVFAAAIIISMYGGGFATIPAYLRDVFGTAHVGAIHGRLLTAWSAAGVIGPVAVTYIRQFEIDQGVAKADAYNITMYIMAGLLLIGFIANFMMTPVGEKHYMQLREAEALT